MTSTEYLDYDMCTEVGDQAVHRMVTEAAYRTRALLPEADVSGWVAGRMRWIAEQGHPEVFTDLVRHAIECALGDAWTEAYGHPFNPWGMDQ